ncbi:hypothetical protein FYK18_26440 (plasmid) [Escherichia albertii]|nr:hypothetical protein FYK18_26440 [Escherichia albertii]
MVLSLTMKIISGVILCVFLNYHITCPFPAAQIRFPAVTDLPLPPHNAPSVSTACSAAFSCS